MANLTHYRKFGVVGVDLDAGCVRGVGLQFAKQSFEEGRSQAGVWERESVKDRDSAKHATAELRL